MDDLHHQHDDSAAPRSSTLDLVTGLVTDARDLAMAHIDGVRLEMKEELVNLKTATLQAAISLAVFVVAGLMAAFAAAHAITAYTPVPLWGSFAITSAVFAVVGLALRTRRRIASADRDLIPEQQLASARRDAEWAVQEVRNAVV